MAASTTTVDVAGDEVLHGILQRLDVSDQFVNANLEFLPLTGPHQPKVIPQIRQHTSTALTPDGLAGLASSIMSVGQLQPIIVERLNDGTLRVVAGQRRLAAMQLGLQQHPDNPHLAQGIRALVVDGELGPYERRAVQMAENLERRDLSQVDKGRALWMSRVSLLADRISAAGFDVPDWPELMADRLRDAPTAIDDPVERFQALLRWKGANAPQLHKVGVAWTDAAAALGMDAAEETARDIARQYRDLGETRLEVMSELGATTRTLRAARNLTNQGHGEAVDEIAARVRELQASSSGEFDAAQVAAEALQLAASDPDTRPAEIVDRIARSQADTARRNRPLTLEDAAETPPAPETVDVSLLAARLREINRTVDERLRPLLAAIEDGLLAGAALAADDRETIGLLLDDLNTFVGDLRSTVDR